MFISRFFPIIRVMYTGALLFASSSEMTVPGLHPVSIQNLYFTLTFLYFPRFRFFYSLVFTPNAQIVSTDLCQTTLRMLNEYVSQRMAVCLSLPSLSFVSHLFFSTLYSLALAYFSLSFLLYTSLVLMILKWRITLAHSLSLSCFFSLSFTRSLFFSRILVGCWVTKKKKNSSLNKYTIQKLLSYRLTASVKRIILSFFFFSPLLFKYLKKLSFGKPCLNPQT